MIILIHNFEEKYVVTICIFYNSVVIQTFETYPFLQFLLSIKHVFMSNCMLLLEFVMLLFPSFFWFEWKIHC